MRKLVALLAIPLLVLAACGGGSASPSRSLSPAGSPAPKPSPFAGTEGYILEFGSDFRPGMNAVDEFGISVVIAMDVSGSMAQPPRSGGRPKYIQATSALATVARYLQTLSGKQKDLKIRVSILKFSDGVDVVLPLSTLDAKGIERLSGVINPGNFAPVNGTGIGRAMEAGSKILAQSGTIFNSLILVTDGENNLKPDPRDVMKAMYSNRNSATTMDFKVNTSSQLVSFVGFDVQSKQFEDFHALGARITSAASQKEIEDGLKSFLEADITKLEGR